MGTHSARVVSAPALNLVEVDVNDLPRFWDMLEPLVINACEHSGGAFSPKIVLEGVYHGAMKMLALVEDGQAHSIMVLQVNQMPTGLRFLSILLVGGRDMDAWLPFEPELDDLARAHGCAMVRTIGRKGLAKKLPHWRMSQIVLERSVTDGEG